MKKSRYTLEIAGNRALINTLYGSVIELDDENQRKYEDILLDRNIDKYTEEIDLLLREGILIKDSQIEEKELNESYEEIKHDTRTLQLVIFTTTACNMQCVYCFEHLNPIYPEQGNADDVMQFIVDRYRKHPFDRLAITWFGGEPLINMEYIRELSEKMLQFTGKKGAAYEAFMITNGTLLTYDVAHELKEKWKVSGLQITVDGTKERHNIRRPYGKKDGFSIIMNHIKEVHKEIQVVLRINVDKENANEVEELLGYLSECGDLKEDVLLDFGKVVGDSPSCMTFSEFESERIHLNRMLEKYGFHYTLKHFSLEGRLLSCSVLTDNAFVIYPNGDLYKCYEVAGRKEFCIGNIKKFQENYENKIAEQFQIKEECTECNKFPLCNKHICPYRYHSDMIQCMYTDENIYETIEIMKREQFT